MTKTFSAAKIVLECRINYSLSERNTTGINKSDKNINGEERAQNIIMLAYNNIIIYNKKHSESANLRREEFGTA